MKKNIIYSVFAILALCCAPALFAGKKKEKGPAKPPHDDFDIIIQQQQLRNQREAERQEQEKLQKRLLKEEAENKKLKEQIKLLKDYPLLKEFQESQENIDLADKNILKHYYAWLQGIKKLYLEQDTYLQILLQYSKIQKEYLDIDNKFTTAWGKCLTKFPDNSFKISYTSKESINIKEFILNTRYLDDIFNNENFNNAFYLTESDTAFLEACKDDKETEWLANTILITAQRNIISTQKTSFLNRAIVGIKYFKEQLQPLRPSLRRDLFTTYDAMALLSSQHIGQVKKNEHNVEKFCADMQQLYDARNSNDSKMLTTLNLELEKLSAKYDVPQPKKQIVEKVQPVKETKKEKVHIPDTTTLNSEPEKNDTVVKEKPKTEPKILFSVEHKKQSLFNSQADRVLKWYTDPDQALQDNETTLGKPINKKHHDNIIKRHTFSDNVDYFIDTLAIQCDWKKKGKLSYNIPGQMIDLETGKETTGVFSYGVYQDDVDENNKVLFHRCFSEESYQEVEDIVRKRTYEAEFPSLDSTSKQSFKMHKVDDFDKKLVSQNNFYVEIKDEKNNMLLRLFKVKNK